MTRERFFVDRHRLASGLLLGLLVLAVYLPVLDGGFLWDDDVYVSENGNLRDARGLLRIWLEPQSSPQYYPMVFTSFWIERQLFGSGPVPGHVTNVALHVLNALLLWAVLRRLDVAPAFFIALVFALHPVELESVAWITERKNVLSTSFYLASLQAYLAFALPPRTGVPPPPERARRLRLLSLVLFACALLSKTVTVTLPAVLLLLLWWKREKLTWRDAAPLVPFVLLAIPFGLLTAWLETHHVGAAGEDWSLSPVGRLLLAGRVVWFYARKLLWPPPLMFVYPRWLIDTSSFVAYLFPATAVAAVLALYLLRRKLGKGPLVAALFFLVSLFPALGFFNVYPMRFSYVADHFQYVAGIGLLALAVVAGDRLLARTGLPGLRAPAAAAVALLLVLTGRREIRKFHDLETLWEDTLSKNPEAWIAHNNLGNLRMQRGRYREARDAFEEVLRIRPGSAIACNNLGTAWFREGDVPKALEYHRKAVDLDPEYAEAHNNLGVDLASLQRVEEAIGAYRRALRIDPGYAMAHYNLANSLSRVNRLAEAETHYREAIRLQPGLALAHFYLGLSLLTRGREAEATRSLDEAFRLKPDFALGHYELGNLRLRKGETAGAVESYSEAIRIRPDTAEAWCNRGSARMQQSRVEEAIADYREAVRIRPDYAIAHRNLGLALERQGRRDEARAHYAEATRIDGAGGPARQNGGTPSAPERR